EAAQVGRHAAEAAMRRVGEPFEQRIPDEGGLREAVQEHHQRAARLAGGAAAQGDAVRQGAFEGLDGHVPVSWWLVVLSSPPPSGCVQPQSSSAASPTPWRLRAENSLTSPPPACSRAMDSALAASERES